MSDTTRPAADEPSKDTFRRMRRVYGTFLALAWEAARGRWAALIASGIMLGLSGAVGGLITKAVVDALASGRAASAWAWAAAYLLQFGASTFLNHLMMFLQFDLSERIAQDVDQRLMAVASGVPGLDHLERPEYADRLKVVRDFQYVPFSALANVNALSYMVFGLGSAVVLLAWIHPLLGLLPVVSVPSALMQFLSYRKHYHRFDETAPEERLAQHYLELATEPRSAKEVRLFGLGPLLVERHRRVADDYVRTLLRDRLKRTGVTLVAGALNGAALAAAMGFVGWLALAGRASLGDVALAVQVTRMAIGHVEMAANLFAWLAELSYSAERYLWLLDYGSDDGAERASGRVSSPVRPVPVPGRIETGIVLDGVSFAYPGGEAPVLSDVSFVIPAGSTVALVGENGAGKSTIVKLLCRFYDPTSGSIRVDDVDLRELDVAAWRERIAAAFQDFVRFQLVAREAVGIGDLGRIDDLDRVTASSVRSGADRTIRRLPDGYATQLGREFEGGTDLSEGEWQRVAIARGGMRPAPLLLVMDEPTANLDARAEHEVFERFAELSRGAGGDRPVTVLVSHRFSTVRMADLIVVLSDGAVAEIGSHDELVSGGGRYAELFGLQASRYA